MRTETRGEMPQIKQINENRKKTTEIEEQKRKRTNDQAVENKRRTETIEGLKRKQGRS